MGHYNHKYFILFIWYTVAIGLYNCFTLFLWAYPMREEDQDMLFDEFYLWANVGVSGIFGGLQIFFGVHHINLVRANNTTIELIGARRIKNKARQRMWDLGPRGNLQQVSVAAPPLEILLFLLLFLLLLHMHTSHVSSISTRCSGPVNDFGAAHHSFRQVFGPRWVTWALPCVQGCQGDGYSYPKKT